RGGYRTSTFCGSFDARTTIAASACGSSARHTREDVSQIRAAICAHNSVQFRRRIGEHCTASFLAAAEKSRAAGFRTPGNENRLASTKACDPEGDADAASDAR